MQSCLRKPSWFIFCIFFIGLSCVVDIFFALAGLLQLLPVAAGSTGPTTKAEFNVYHLPYASRDGNPYSV